MKQNNENLNAFLLHISAFAGFVFPFGNVIAPLIAWQTLKDRSTFLDEQGKEVVNFNLSYTFYVFLISITFIPFSVRPFFKNWNNFYHPISINFDMSSIFGFIGFGSIAVFIYPIVIVLVIIASLKAREGENYKYPFTIKFIK